MCCAEISCNVLIRASSWYGMTYCFRVFVSRLSNYNFRGQFGAFADTRALSAAAIYLIRVLYLLLTPLRCLYNDLSYLADCMLPSIPPFLKINLCNWTFFF